MERRTKQMVLVALLVFVMAISAACESRVEDSQAKDGAVAAAAAASVPFEPEFSEARMMDTIKWLASKDNSRISGLEGEALAAEWLMEQYEAMGLEVSSQSFPVKAYVCDFLELKVVTDGERAVEEAKALSYSAATPVEGIMADVVPLGRGAESDYAGKDVEGKVVLVQRGGEFFYVKTARAASKGAAAVLFYDPNSEGALSATLMELSKIPAVSITRADGEVFEKALLDGETVTVSLKVEVMHEDSTSQNLIGVYKSTDNPDGKNVIVGAHYDGVDTPAANDNASGVAVVLEMAKVISEQKVALPYDVEFVLFGSEEIGLIGSNYYVEKMTRDEKDSVVAMLNFDMVGVGDVFDIGYAEGFPAPNLIKMARETLKEMGHTPSMTPTSRSDHGPFAQAGIDAIMISVGPDHNYHTDLDTIDVIQTELLVDVCKLGAELVVSGFLTQ